MTSRLSEPIFFTTRGGWQHMQPEWRIAVGRSRQDLGILLRALLRRLRTLRCRGNQIEKFVCRRGYVVFSCVLYGKRQHLSLLNTNSINRKPRPEQSTGAAVKRKTWLCRCLCCCYDVCYERAAAAVAHFSRNCSDIAGLLDPTYRTRSDFTVSLVMYLG